MQTYGSSKKADNVNVSRRRCSPTKKDSAAIHGATAVVPPKVPNVYEYSWELLDDTHVLCACGYRGAL